MQAKEAEVAQQRAALSASEPDSAVFKYLEEVRQPFANIVSKATCAANLLVFLLSHCIAF
jgi:hypothetical protein